MVFYYADIPRTQAANGLLSFISDKVIVYLMAVQVFSIILITTYFIDQRFKYLIRVVALVEILNR